MKPLTSASFQILSRAVVPFFATPNFEDQSCSSPSGDADYPLVIKNRYGKSLFFMGKSTISMAIFNSYFDITRG